MVITVPVRGQTPVGLRPIDLNRDIPQVLRLLELVFGKALGSEGWRVLGGNVGLNRQPAFLWRLTPGASRLAMGYVWEKDGLIIGNATVLGTKIAGRFLVVNVAVHPDYRRQGIARVLMDTVIDMVRQRQGHEILLQVVKENVPAVGLYESLAFNTLGSLTAWRTTVSRLKEIPELVDGDQAFQIRELRRKEWRDAYELDLMALQSGLNWPEPLLPAIYQEGFWRRIDRFLNGRHFECWVIADNDDQVIGLAGVWGEWLRPYHVKLRIHPHWLGHLERPLLAKVIRRLHRLPRRNIRLDHRDDDEVMNQLLREANFHAERTLTHMQLKL